MTATTSSTLYVLSCKLARIKTHEYRPDPNDILAFLVDELHSAEKAGQKAWIFAHLPPGSGDVVRDQVRSSLALPYSDMFDLLSKVQLLRPNRPTLSAHDRGSVLRPHAP